MTYNRRTNTIERALVLVKFLQTKHGWVCSADLAPKLQVCTRQAKVWLNAAAKVLPLEVRRHEAKLDGRGSCDYFRVLI